MAIRRQDILERAIRNAKMAEDYAVGVDDHARCAEAWAHIARAMGRDQDHADVVLAGSLDD